MAREKSSREESFSVSSSPEKSILPPASPPSGRQRIPERGTGRAGWGHGKGTEISQGWNSHGPLAVIQGGPQGTEGRLCPRCPSLVFTPCRVKPGAGARGPLPPTRWEPAGLLRGSPASPSPVIFEGTNCAKETSRAWGRSAAARRFRALKDLDRRPPLSLSALLSPAVCRRRRSSGHIPAAPPPLSSQFVPQEPRTSLSPPVTSGHGGLGGEDASVGRGQVEGSRWGWSPCTAAAQAGAGLGQEEVNPSHSPVKFGQVTALPKA